MKLHFQLAEKPTHIYFLWELLVSRLDREFRNPQPKLLKVQIRTFSIFELCQNQLHLSTSVFIQTSSSSSPRLGEVGAAVHAGRRCKQSLPALEGPSCCEPLQALNGRFSLPNVIPSAVFDAFPARGTELLTASKHIASLWSLLSPWGLTTHS